MSTELKVQEAKLPTLADLHHDIEIAFKNDKFNMLVNQEPPEKWIKKHPTAKKEILNDAGQTIKVPIDYLPIEKVEFMLHRIFQEWRTELLREGQLFNSVYAAVRVHYKHPISGEWTFHDGAGAVGVQTDAGKSAADLSAIKANAVQIALPAAISYAIKDAAEHIGKLFGRDLNRKDTLPFTVAYDKPAKAEIIDIPGDVRFNIEISDQTEHFTAIWNNNPQLQSNPEFMKLIQETKLKNIKK